MGNGFFIGTLIKHASHIKFFRRKIERLQFKYNRRYTSIRRNSGQHTNQQQHNNAPNGKLLGKPSASVGRSAIFIRKHHGYRLLTQPQTTL